MNQVETIRSIFAVIVVYKEYIENTVTYKSLIDSLESAEIENLDLLIYDNSPEYHYISSAVLPSHSYIHNPSNPGLSEAYNTALRLAREKNKQWILLLDDDTVINRDFLTSTFHYASELNAQNDIVAIVPEIQTRKRKVVSPCKVTFTGLFIPFSLKSSKILKGRVSALNSGSLLKLKFLADINGFSEEFPIDMLDHWVFRQIYLNKKKVFGSNKVLVHDLSVTSNEYMDKVRYSHTFLPAENRFFREERRFTSSCHKIVLIARVFRQLFLARNEIAGATWKAFLNKI